MADAYRPGHAHEAPVISPRQIATSLRPATWRGRAWRSRAWGIFLAIGMVLTAGYFLLGTADQDFYYQLPEMLAVSAILIGIRLNRPADPRPWFMLAIGLALTTIGDWTWLILDRVYGIEPFPSLADVFYLVGMLVVAAAILWLVRGRVPGGDRAGVIDALIVTVGVGLVSWVFFMAPIVADASQTPVEIGAAIAYPLLDLLLLGVLVRLLLAPGRQVLALRLLLGGFVTFLLSDFPYAVMALTDSYTVGHPIDAGWLIGAVLWGTAALHPTMREVARPAEPGEPRISGWRLGLLASASLMAPIVLLIQWLSGATLDVPVVAAASVVLFLLVIARLATVVGALRTTLDQRRVLERELERRALHDPLTGLANRVLFHDRLKNALARREGSVAVMFLDLDDFKMVNDAHGHASGDAVLRSVAATLSGAVRPADTVARLGGDEFAVLLTDSPNRYAASLVAGRLLDAVQAPIELAGGYRYTIGVSIGISLGAATAAASPTGAPATADDLMRDADIAMYVAKGQGKGTFTVFESTEHHAVVRGFELRNDLDSAIRERQFELHYQPIFDLDSGKVAGMEALVRWQHPILGQLEPAEFITLAESTGAIVPLGRWILEEACSHAVGWQRQYPDQADDRFIGVNLSAVQLADPAFAGVVADVLAASGLPAQRLVLELTETAQLDEELAATALRKLRETGVRLAIDDFGTGYAALTHLARTPFDLLKIDGTFTARLGTDAQAESLVLGILDMGRRLGVPVVAEGIEDGVQVARLRDAGCALGQGFHFARPMPAAAVAAFLREHAPAPSPFRAPALGTARLIRPA